MTETEVTWSRLRRGIRPPVPELVSALRATAACGGDVPNYVRAHIAAYFRPRSARSPSGPSATDVGTFNYWAVWEAVLFHGQHPPNPTIARAILADHQPWEPELSNYLAARLHGDLAASVGRPERDEIVRRQLRVYWVNRWHRWHRAIRYLRRTRRVARIRRLAGDANTRSLKAAALQIVHRESGHPVNTLRRWVQARPLPPGVRAKRQQRADLLHIAVFNTPHRTTSEQLLLHERFFADRIRRNAEAPERLAYWRQRRRVVSDLHFARIDGPTAT